MSSRRYLQMLSMFLVLAVPGYAIAADDLAAYRDAGNKMASLVAQAEKANNGKMLQTKEVDQLVAVLSDEKRFLKSAPYSKDQLKDLLQLCSVTNKALMSLALFHIKGSIDPKADRKVIVAQVSALMQKNTQSFSRHLQRLQPFMIRCTAKQVKPLSEFMASLPPEQLTPVRRKGLQRARVGFMQMFVGVVKNSGDKSLDKAYRLAIVRALAESAPDLISTLPLTARARLKSIATASRDSVPAGFESYMKQIYKALDNNVCEGLCAI